MKKNVIFLLLSTLLWSACAPSSLIKPLKKNENAVSANLGGPLISFSNAPIPIPLTGLSYARGINDQFTAFTRLHLTSAMFGVIHIEPGCLYGLREAKGWTPGISLAPSVHFMRDTWEGNGRIYPQLDISCYWNTSAAKDSVSQNFLYTGLSNWIEWRNTGTAGRDQNTHWLPAWQVGHTWMKNRWRYSLEGKYIAPFNSNQNIVVDYIAPGKSGAFGLYFSISKTF